LKHPEQQDNQREQQQNVNDASHRVGSKIKIVLSRTVLAIAGPNKGVVGREAAADER
jgi:hypothetical protein